MTLKLTIWPRGELIDDNDLWREKPNTKLSEGSFT